MAKDPRLRLFCSPIDLSRYNFHIRFSDGKPYIKTNISVVICTLGREKTLVDTLDSLELQTYRNFEVVIVTSKKGLAQARDEGLRSAIGDIVTFIDDDVVCSPEYLHWISHIFFTNDKISGLSGPTEIVDEYRNNRDLFKFKKIKALYDYFFNKSEKRPGQLSDCGSPSTNSNNNGCVYTGEVDFLEACNMSVRRKHAIEVGGFDLGFIGTSEWCEPDLSIRIGNRFGSLFYDQRVALRHYPSQSGVYKKRLETAHRWKNFIYFQKKMGYKGFKTLVYRMFIWTYFYLKGKGVI